MVEFIYDVIRATPGEDVDIPVEFYDSNGNALKGKMVELKLYDTDFNMITGSMVATTATGGSNKFTPMIFGSTTADFKGKYYYDILLDGKAMCFKKPIYFM